MSIGDGGSFSSLSFSPDSQVHNAKREDLSPEDAAWVDSCLIKESEFSDDSWDSLKDALLEVLNSPESFSDKSSKEKDVEMLNPAELVEADQSQTMHDETEKGSPRISFNGPPGNEEAESSGSGKFPIEDVSDSQSLRFVVNPFLPNYIEGAEETIQTTASGSDSNSTLGEIEPSTDDIFRVWDLNVPAEENELSVQLKKILDVEENYPHLKPHDDSGAREYLKGVSLDNLIESIANMSLGQNSTRRDEK